MASEKGKNNTCNKSFCSVLLHLKHQKMNTKPSLSQTKILSFETRLNDTRTRYGRSTISATLSSKPVYSGGELKAAKETRRIEPSNQKNASNEDNFLSKIAISYLSKTLQDTAGSYLTSFSRIFS